MRYRRSPGPVFRHGKRECVWCLRRFRPVETLGPTSTEHFCSSECALESSMARRHGPESYISIRTQARERYQEQRSEMLLRMEKMRAKRWEQCEVKA